MHTERVSNPFAYAPLLPRLYLLQERPLLDSIPLQLDTQSIRDGVAQGHDAPHLELPVAQIPTPVHVSLGLRVSSGRVAAGELEQAGVLCAQDRRLRHQVAVDAVDGELGQIAAGGAGHVSEYAVGVARVDLGEEILAPGLTVRFRDGLPQRLVLVELLL